MTSDRLRDKRAGLVLDRERYGRTIQAATLAHDRIIQKIALIDARLAQLEASSKKENG